MEMAYEPPAGTPTYLKRCVECRSETPHFQFQDDRNDELRGSGRIPVDRYEVCTSCQHTTDLTNG